MEEIFANMEWWRWVLLFTIMPSLLVGAFFLIKSLYKELFIETDSEESGYKTTIDYSKHKSSSTHDSGTITTITSSATIFTAANM